MSASSDEDTDSELYVDAIAEDDLYYNATVETKPDNVEPLDFQSMCIWRNYSIPAVPYQMLIFFQFSEARAVFNCSKYATRQAERKNLNKLNVEKTILTYQITNKTNNKVLRSSGVHPNKECTCKSRGQLSHVSRSSSLKQERKPCRLTILLPCESKSNKSRERSRSRERYCEKISFIGEFENITLTSCNSGKLPSQARIKSGTSKCHNAIRCTHTRPRKDYKNSYTEVRERSCFSYGNLFLKRLTHSSKLTEKLQRGQCGCCNESVRPCTYSDWRSAPDVVCKHCGQTKTLCLCDLWKHLSRLNKLTSVTTVVSKETFHKKMPCICDLAKRQRDTKNPELLSFMKQLKLENPTLPVIECTTLKPGKNSFKIRRPDIVKNQTIKDKIQSNKTKAYSGVNAFSAKKHDSVQKPMLPSKLLGKQQQDIVIYFPSKITTDIPTEKLDDESETKNPPTAVEYTSLDGASSQKSFKSPETAMGRNLEASHPSPENEEIDNVESQTSSKIGDGIREMPQEIIDIKKPKEASQKYDESIETPLKENDKAKPKKPSQIEDREEEQPVRKIDNVKPEQTFQREDKIKEKPQKNNSTTISEKSSQIYDNRRKKLPNKNDRVKTENSSHIQSEVIEKLSKENGNEKLEKSSDTEDRVRNKQSKKNDDVIPEKPSQVEGKLREKPPKENNNVNLEILSQKEDKMRELQTEGKVYETPSKENDNVKGKKSSQKEDKVIEKTSEKKIDAKPENPLQKEDEVREKPTDRKVNVKPSNPLQTEDKVYETPSKENDNVKGDKSSQKEDKVIKKTSDKKIVAKPENPLQKEDKVREKPSDRKVNVKPKNSLQTEDRVYETPSKENDNVKGETSSQKEDKVIEKTSEKKINSKSEHPLQTADEVREKPSEKKVNVKPKNSSQIEDKIRKTPPEANDHKSYEKPSHVKDTEIKKLWEENDNPKPTLPSQIENIKGKNLPKKISFSIIDSKEETNNNKTVSETIPIDNKVRDEEQITKDNSVIQKTLERIKTTIEVSEKNKVRPSIPLFDVKNNESIAEKTMDNSKPKEKVILRDAEDEIKNDESVRKETSLLSVKSEIINGTRGTEQTNMPLNSIPIIEDDIQSFPAEKTVRFKKYVTCSNTCKKCSRIPRSISRGSAKKTNSIPKHCRCCYVQTDTQKDKRLAVREQRQPEIQVEGPENPLLEKATSVAYTEPVIKRKAGCKCKLPSQSACIYTEKTLLKEKPNEGCTIDHKRPSTSGRINDHPNKRICRCKLKLPRHTVLTSIPDKRNETTSETNIMMTVEEVRQCNFTLRKEKSNALTIASKTVFEKKKTCHFYAATNTDQRISLDKYQQCRSRNSKFSSVKCRQCRVSQTGGTIEQDMIASYVARCTGNPECQQLQQFLTQTMLYQFTGYEFNKEFPSQESQKPIEKVEKALHKTLKDPVYSLKRSSMHSVQIQVGLSCPVKCEGVQTITTFVLKKGSSNLDQPEPTFQANVNYVCTKDVPGLRTKLATTFTDSLSEKLSCICASHQVDLDEIVGSFQESYIQTENDIDILNKDAAVAASSIIPRCNASNVPDTSQTAQTTQNKMNYVCGPDIPELRSKLAMLLTQLPSDDFSCICPSEQLEEDGEGNSMKECPNRLIDIKDEEVITQAYSKRSNCIVTKKNKCIFITPVQTEPYEPNFCIIFTTPNEKTRNTEYRNTEDAHTSVTMKKPERYEYQTNGNKNTGDCPETEIIPSFMKKPSDNTKTQKMFSVETLKSTDFFHFIRKQPYLMQNVALDVPACRSSIKSTCAAVAQQLDTLKEDEPESIRKTNSDEKVESRGISVDCSCGYTCSATKTVAELEEEKFEDASCFSDNFYDKKPKKLTKHAKIVPDNNCLKTSEANVDTCNQKTCISLQTSGTRINQVSIQTLSPVIMITIGCDAYDVDSIENEEKNINAENCDLDMNVFENRDKFNLMCTEKDICRPNICVNTCEKGQNPNEKCWMDEKGTSHINSLDSSKFHSASVKEDSVSDYQSYDGSCGPYVSEDLPSRNECEKLTQDGSQELEQGHCDLTCDSDICSIVIMEEVEVKCNKTGRSEKTIILSCSDKKSYIEKKKGGKCNDVVSIKNKIKANLDQKDIFALECAMNRFIQTNHEQQTDE